MKEIYIGFKCPSEDGCKTLPFEVLLIDMHSGLHAFGCGVSAKKAAGNGVDCGTFTLKTRL